MKYEYIGTMPTVCVVEGKLIQVNKGDFVNLAKPVSSEFVAVYAPQKKVSAPTPKVTQPQKEVRKNATTTQTSSLGK